MTACVLAALCGCGPSAYERWADRQVYALVEDREKATLGYTPQVTAESDARSIPTKKAYERLPLTVLPNDVDEAYIDSQSVREFGLYGPEMIDLPEGFFTTVSVVDSAQSRVETQLAYGPPLESGNVQVLGLYDAIAYGVEHSRDYQTQMEQVYLSALSVTLERYLFSPRPFASVSGTINGDRSEGAGSDWRAATAVTTEAGVRQRLPYGGEVVARVLVDFVNVLQGNLSDGENARVALTASIPLLRGAGLVNLEDLISSERSLIYAVRLFEQFRRNFAVDVSTQYFRLLAAQQSVRNRYLNYVTIDQLRGQTEALFAAGRINALQVQRSLTELLDAEDQLNSAIASYDTQLDNFKLQIGMPVSTALEVVPVSVAVDQPELDGIDAATVALAYRLDLQTVRDQLEDARRRASVARNGLLPDLDVIAEVGTDNVNDTPASSIDGRGVDYSAGLRLEIPIDRLPERNRYRQSLIQVERAQRDVVEAEEQVLADVRNSVRSIRSARLSLEINQRNIELARQRVDFANELLITGRSDDASDVTEAQNALLRAQDQFEQARADLQVQVLRFLRDTGTLRVDPSAGVLGTVMRRTGTAETLSDSLN